MKKSILILTLFFNFTIFANEVSDFTVPIYKTQEKFTLSEKIKDYDKIVLNFWASWCLPCKEEIPELEALKSRYQKDKVLFIAINAGEKAKKIKKFIKKTKFSYLILEDKNRLVSKSLGVTSLPQTFVIDKKRKILFKGNRPPKDI